MSRNMHMRVGLAAISVVSITIGLIPQGASAEPGPGSASMVEPKQAGLPPGFASWRELFDAQQHLDAAATRIEEAALANPESGFASVTVDAATRSLTVYWHGQPSAEEKAVIDSVQGPAGSVKVVPAKFSKLELDAQVALIKQDALAIGPERVTHITKRTDGSGIQVGVSSSEMTVNGAVPADLGSRLSRVQAARQKVDIFIVRGATEQSPMATREADTPSWWGGAVVRWPNDSFCSSGFAVHYPLDGFDYMTTARHCLGVGQMYSNGNNTWNMGPGTPGNDGHDLMFIRTAAGSGSRIYTGPRANTPGQGSMPVRRVSQTHVGDHLCTGGASTGWHCYIRASGPTWDCRPWIAEAGLGTCFSVEGGITQIEGQLIMGKGDSGGPVWSPINGFDQPDSAADARGLISSLPDGWTWIPCGNDPILGRPNVCATAVWFTPLLNAITPWVDGGMYVKTQ